MTGQIAHMDLLLTKTYIYLIYNNKILIGNVKYCFLLNQALFKTQWPKIVDLIQSEEGQMDSTMNHEPSIVNSEISLISDVIISLFL